VSARPPFHRATPPMTTSGTVDRATSEAALERSIGRLLTVGTYASIALLALGFVLLLASGLGPRSSAPRFDPARLVADIAALRPEGPIWLGLAIVVATPSARVVAALVAYQRRGERVMAAIAALILVVIAASVVVARVTEG
jgi:uncharacterized membrane protein